MNVRLAQTRWIALLGLAAELVVMLAIWPQMSQASAPNRGMLTTPTAAVGPVEIYLAFIPADYPPLPPSEAPVLHDITNPDQKSSYTVSWSAVAGATEYTLEEAENAGFSGAQAAYSGPNTSTAIAGKSTGTYYYRVKASNTAGSSGWSNVQSTQVVTEPRPYDWMLLPTGTTDALAAVYFLDAQTGWVLAGQQTVLYTENGGQSWEARTSPTSKKRNDLFFLDKDRGWIVGNDALILSTIDGGKTWTEQASPVSTDYDLSTIQFVDADHGWIAAHNIWMSPNPPINMRFYGHVLRTTDGGQSWESVYYNSSRSVDDLFFVDANQGWHLSTTFDPSRIDWWYSVYHTSNGGDTWGRQSIPTETYLRDIYMVDATTGWMVGDDDWNDGPVWRTTNGSNWVDATTGADQDLYGVHFVGVNQGWIRSASAIWHTANGGMDWAPQTLEPGCTGFTDFFFVPTGQGWVVGENGIVCEYH
jgi:photosystem II stability/assembly factor-like uncharacterized protein